MGFVFVLCAPGAERALKGEVPWPASYQRPGFVTFKREGSGPIPDFVFARERSESLGRVASVGEVRADLVRVSARVPELSAALPPWPEARAPRDGETVGEVVLVGEGELWAGTHVHDRSHSIYAGGLAPEPLPEAAPSRAYLKLERVIEWWGRGPSVGEVVLELGSAPGGASWALLARGAEVFGVDPGQMDARVLAHPRFRWIEGSINVLDPSRLPERVDWIVADMNVDPRLTLDHAEALAARLGARGLLLTLKLRSWALAQEVPRWIARVERAGFADVRAKQLSCHGREIALVASLTRGS